MGSQVPKMTRKLDAERQALDFAGFAQEFLRRNPTYRSEYAAIMHSPETDRTTAALEAMARSWGLRFPLFPGPTAST